jgi:hypothetical protein
MDIITAHGDNADYSNIPKAYHGIRIHINSGNNKFAENSFTLFMELPGCWQKILIRMEMWI